MEGCAVELGSLVESLSQQVGRTIVDTTGLKGLYDIKLQWMPDTPPPNNSVGTGASEEFCIRLYTRAGFRLDNKGFRHAASYYFGSCSSKQASLFRDRQYV